MTIKVLLRRRGQKYEVFSPGCINLEAQSQNEAIEKYYRWLSRAHHAIDKSYIRHPKGVLATAKRSFETQYDSIITAHKLIAERDLRPETTKPLTIEFYIVHEDRIDYRKKMKDMNIYVFSSTRKRSSIPQREAKKYVEAFLHEGLQETL